MLLLSLIATVSAFVLHLTVCASTTCLFCFLFLFVAMPMVITRRSSTLSLTLLSASAAVLFVLVLVFLFLFVVAALMLALHLLAGLMLVFTFFAMLFFVSVTTLFLTLSMLFFVSVPARSMRTVPRRHLSYSLGLDRLGDFSQVRVELLLQIVFYLLFKLRLGLLQLFSLATRVCVLAVPVLPVLAMVMMLPVSVLFAHATFFARLLIRFSVSLSWSCLARLFTFSASLFLHSARRTRAVRLFLLVLRLPLGVRVVHDACAASLATSAPASASASRRRPSRIRTRTTRTHGATHHFGKVAGRAAVLQQHTGAENEEKTGLLQMQNGCAPG